MGPRLKYLVQALVAVLLALAPLALSSYLVHVASLMLVYAVFAMSLDILIGQLGMTSFGHAAFFGAGAYMTGIFSTKLSVSPWAAAALALAGVALVAAVFGLVALRTTGLSFVMITLALGQALWGLAYRWVPMTGGDQGLPGIPRPSLGWAGSGQLGFYYLILVAFGLAFFALSRFVSSPFGLTLRGIRDSELRMQTLGFHSWLHKYIAYIVAGTFAGVGGVLYAWLNRYVNPADLYLTRSAEGIMMVILGGPGTLLGPAIGAALITLIRNFVSTFTDRWVLVLGVLYVITVMFLPGGVVGFIQRALQRRLAARGGAEPVAAEGRTSVPQTGKART